MQNSTNKFLKFIESIKNKENTILIETITKAFKIISESWDPLSEKASNEAFKEEVSNEMEDSSPLVNDKVLKINGYDVHILDYDNGNTEAWVKDIGNVAINPYWKKTNMNDFINNIKLGISKKISK